MKRIIQRACLCFFIIITTALISCKNFKHEDDYYYTETASTDDNEISVTLKGTGYGLYGQLIAKSEYRSGSLEDFLKGGELSFKTTSADSNNATYNEIFLIFEPTSIVNTFSINVAPEKTSGLASLKVSYTDTEDKENTLTSSCPIPSNLTIGKDVKKITLYIKAYKFYPSSYSSLTYKADEDQDDFNQNKADKQVNNTITISGLKIE